jgi:hypothetical protein
VDDEIGNFHDLAPLPERVNFARCAIVLGIEISPS